LATIVGTLFTSCLMPFVALAVMTAATLSRGRAALTIGAAWLANQILGFTLLHYPPTPFAISWGAAVGVAALVAMFVARMVVERGEVSALKLMLAFGLGFLAYEGLLYGFASVVGGKSGFTAAVIATIGVNDGVWLALLATTYLLLTWSAPRWFGRIPQLRLA
jgi:hypothetical protein